MAAGLLLFTQDANAQHLHRRPVDASGPGVVTGQAVAQDGTLLGGALVEILTASDSIVLRNTLSNAAGQFQFRGVPMGSFLVRASYLGHNDAVIPVEITDEKPNVVVGKIALMPSAIALEGLVITAERNVVSLQADRMVYNAAEAQTNSGGSAVDVLRNVPGLDVDMDGNVSLRGQEAAIQIDGRDAPLRGDALANFLRQLDAGAIEKVEVVSNPSAKHDPEGVAGIVNIILEKQATLRPSASLNGTWATDRLNAGAAFALPFGPVHLHGGVTLMRMTPEFSTETLRENYLADPWEFRLAQRSTAAAEHENPIYRLGADIQLSKSLALSPSFMFSDMSGNYDNRTVNRFADSAGHETEVRISDSRTGHEIPSYDAGVVLRHRGDDPANVFTSDFRYSRSDELFFASYSRPGEGEFMGTRQDAENREYIWQNDITRTIGDLRLEFGHKTSLMSLEQTYARTDEGVLSANGMTFDETVHAAYATVARTVGVFDLQAGLRVERTSAEADIDVEIETGSDYDRTYTNVFPSASALYNLDDLTKLRLSYSRRIRRPNERMLNPFGQGLDDMSEFVGNMELRPELTNVLELAFQRQMGPAALQLTPFYRRTQDDITRVKTVNATGESVTTFVNLDGAESYGAEATLSGRLGDRLTGMLSGSTYRRESSSRSGLGSKGLNWNVRASLQAKLSEGLRAQASVFHRGGQPIEQGHMDGFTFSDVALSQQVFGGRGTITLRMSDPFGLTKFSFVTEDHTHWQKSVQKRNMRRVYLGFSWTFGDPLKLDHKMEHAEGEGEPSIF